MCATSLPAGGCFDGAISYTPASSEDFQTAVEISSLLSIVGSRKGTLARILLGNQQGGEAARGQEAVDEPYRRTVTASSSIVSNPWPGQSSRTIRGRVSPDNVPDAGCSDGGQMGCCQ